MQARLRVLLVEDAGVVEDGEDVEVDAEAEVDVDEVVVPAVD